LIDTAASFRKKQGDLKHHFVDDGLKIMDRVCCVWGSNNKRPPDPKGDASPPPPPERGTQFVKAPLGNGINRYLLIEGKPRRSRLASLKFACSTSPALGCQSQEAASLKRRGGVFNGLAV